jgi:ELWxxDGT repeat protein
MVFFSASNSDTGRELYKSDGTEAGTVLVKDIVPGTFVSSIPLELTVFAGELFFTANLEDTDGRELWSTDGTEAGTQMYTDIFPGDEDAFFYDGGYVNMHRNGNTLYLFAINATVGYELFKLEVSDVAVGENEKTSTFEVYPNPASQLVTIKNIEPNQKIVVVDVTGKIIYQENANQSSLELDLAAFENGIYFIQIYEDAQLIETKKLVVSK